ncbi:MAG TPA: response regulator [Propionibacteriaceae bacterium]
MINWYQFSVLANLAIALSLLAISAFIIVPVVRLRLLRVKKLATAIAALLFAVAVGRAFAVLHYLLPGVDRDAPPVTFWWEGLWSLVTAATAIYLLSLYRFLGQLLVGASSFDIMVERREAGQPAGLRAESAGRVAAESARDTGAAMLRSIVANNQAAIYVKDLEGRYLLGNPRHAEIMGRSEADFLGLTDDIVGLDLASTWREKDLRATHGLYQVEETNDLFPDGTHYYESVKFPLYDSVGNVYATAGSSLDVTHERRAKVQLEVARDLALAASAAKSTFLATMSHEIRTPMNAVIGMTDLLLDTELDEQQFEFVDTVRTSGDALLSVINDVLDFSKIESGELRIEREVFALGAEVEGCLDLVVAEATAKGIDLICYVDDSCPARVVGDAARLRQIIVNLLSNAVKFTSEGEILLTVSCHPTDEGRLEVKAVVTDTGIGISVDGLDHLFESFTQVDDSTTRVYGGTGLGLAISRRLARAMGGEITVTSVPAGGSTFTLTLLVDSYAEPEAERDDTPILDLGGLSVLVVDNNLTCLRVMGLQLTSLGMLCTKVATPGEALELVRGGLHVDVAVVDMLMPDLNGAQLASALHEIHATADLPIVLVTSVGSRPPGADGMFAALLAKPVKSASLLRALSAALSGGPSQDSTERRHPIGRAITPLRILLAEDNAVNQRVQQLMLAKLGHQVRTVSNGAAAVAAITMKPYDVVLMDVQMPVMDGLEATRRIRAQIPVNQQPRIVAMTASALVEDRDACAAAGMEDYLSKPVRAAELKAILAGFSAASRARRLDEETRAVEAEPPDREDARARRAELEQPADGGAAAVDVSVLNLLVEQLDDESGQLLGELVDSYLSESATAVKELADAGPKGDGATVRRVAHNLRSTSGLMGATQLVTLLQQVEDAAREGSVDLGPGSLRVRDEFDRVAAMLPRLSER